MKTHVTYFQAVPANGWRIEDELEPTSTVSYSSPCVNIGSYKAAKLVESWRGKISTKEASAFKQLSEDIDSARGSVRKLFKN